MRDMNADRASMMKNRPLRKRENEGRECARALRSTQPRRSVQVSRCEKRRSNLGDFHMSFLKPRFNLRIVATANLRESHTVLKDAP